MNIRGRMLLVVEFRGTVVGAGLAALTLALPDWIERGFGLDPDDGSGLDERIVVGAALLVAAISAWCARRRWRARTLATAYLD